MNADPKARMPSQIPFIIANEGCERFSFYGMRNILTVFLSTMLLMYLPESERQGAAKDVFHSFVIGVYFFPLLGGWLADRFFGKYDTILWFSLIYCAGHGCLAIFEDSPNGFYTGLFLIALGALGMAYMFRQEVLAAGEGTDNMKNIAHAVQEGANAYLTRQFRTLGIFAAVAFFLLLALPADDAVVRIFRSIAFLFGAGFSAAIGYLGMWLAVRANRLRT